MMSLNVGVVNFNSPCATLRRTVVKLTQLSHLKTKYDFVSSYESYQVAAIEYELHNPTMHHACRIYQLQTSAHCYSTRSTRCATSSDTSRKWCSCTAQSSISIKTLFYSTTSAKPTSPRLSMSASRCASCSRIKTTVPKQPCSSRPRAHCRGRRI